MELVNQLSKTHFDDLVEKAKDWALLNGLTMRVSGNVKDRVEFIPFTLLPSKFPRANYKEAIDLQPIINKLVHRIACDIKFLCEALHETVKVDNFTNRLLELHKSTNKKLTQTVHLGLIRSDLMVEFVDNECWDNARSKQVEINTIASGQGWIGTACSELHRYLLKEMNLTDLLADIPENNPVDGLCKGMIAAWKVYNKPSAVVLFVVETGGSQHISDQRFLEYALRRLETDIRVIRRNLYQIGKTAQFEDERLVIDDLEIALVYFRSGYAPEQYPSEIEWRAREIIELSRAIKCPSLGYQLAGTKKIQQVLAQPGYLERFLEIEECIKLRQIFAGLYSLDLNEAGETLIKTAFERPHDFVLKPQREGGSNNLFDDDIRKKLESMKHTSERAGWILMDRIVAAVQKNYLIFPGRDKSNIKLENINSELGIFGVVLGDNERLFLNETVGHTVRSKLSESNEGGVSSGFGACDSPLLVG